MGATVTEEPGQPDPDRAAIDEAAAEAERVGALPDDLNRTLSRLPVQKAARELVPYDQRQLALIKRICAPDADDAELNLLLEVAARTGLNPLLRQIFLAKMKKRNGEDHGRLVLIIGRDGMISLAERYADYQGFDSDVVRANDTFKVRREDGLAVIEHSYEGGIAERGEVVGSWSVVYRAGKRPRYFFAPVEEYRPERSDRTKFMPWFNQESVMMEKCSTTTAHRLAFSLSGLYDEAEFAKQIAGGAVALPGHEATRRPAKAMEEWNWPEDESLRHYLADLFVAANLVQRDSYMPASQRAKLAGCQTEDDFEALAVELTAFIQRHGGTLPEREALEGEVVDEGDEKPVEGQEPLI